VNWTKKNLILKMGISQEEIVYNAQTVTKGLEALKLQHQSLLGGLKSDRPEVVEDESLMSSQLEKSSLLERSLEMIDLGLGEAHVMAAIAGHLQAVEAEKQKLRSQVQKLFF
jgi:kinesin light chain